MTITISLSGIPFSLDLTETLSLNRLAPYLTRNHEPHTFELIPAEELSGQQAELKNVRKELRELTSLIVPVSDRLLKYSRCIIHGLSFAWNGKGFLFLGPSGVGKTTQFKLWKQLYRDEVTILNGDKPILQCQYKNNFLLHPSPWTGKENWFSMNTLPLSGILFLEQGEENRIEQANPSSMVIPLLNQIFYSAKTVTLLNEAADMIDNLIRTIPIWKLTNRGDMDSAALTHQTLQDYYK